MLIDLTQAAELPARPDIVVVGGGAVGLATAVDLARGGQRVVVLEAGSRSLSPASQGLFENAVSTGYPLEGLHLGRFRLLGGTTNFWAGQLVRFDPIVFEERPWVPDGGWPISRSDLDDGYERAQDLIGLKKRLEDDQVWERLKVAPPDPGSDLDYFFTRWAPEPKFARLFESDIATNANLQVVLNAPVVALEAGADGKVTAVVIASANGQRQRLEAGRFILAQGTIEIARLLMVPLADGRAAPWSGNPRLGRGFLDHVDYYAGTVTPIDKARFHQVFDSSFFDGLKYLPKLKLSEAAQREHQLLGIAAHFIFNSSFADDLSALKLFARGILAGKIDGNFLRYPGRLIPLARIAVPMIARYLRYRRTYNPADKGIQLRLTGEQISVPESGMRLTDKQDALGMPIIEMDWRVDGVELETMARFGAMLGEYLEGQGLAKVELDPVLLNRDPAFLSKIDDANHHMGMARMGHTAEDGVVDQNLKVFGTSNLFVTGAAVFRATGFANPTLTGIALGMRLSQAIQAGDV